MLNTSQKGLIYGGFIGDALALGPHWIYNTEQIKNRFMPLRDYQNPGSPFHPNKVAGDFTHYGDQTLLLLEHLSIHQHLDILKFKEAWLKLMASGNLYQDHASKETIQKLSSQKGIQGSDSQELGGLVRSSALFALPNPSLDDMLLQTKLTHNGTPLQEIADFTFRLVQQVLGGTKPSQAIDDLAKTADKNIQPLIEKARSLVEKEPLEAILNMGQSCSAEYAFPASLYLILRYEDDFEAALVQNAYAGGDSAARGMYIGMVLGAYHGLEALPKRWIEALNHKKRIADALDAF